MIHFAYLKMNTYSLQDKDFTNLGTLKIEMLNNNVPHVREAFLNMCEYRMYAGVTFHDITVPQYCKAGAMEKLPGHFPRILNRPLATIDEHLLGGFVF